MVLIFRFYIQNDKPAIFRIRTQLSDNPQRINFRMTDGRINEQTLAFRADLVDALFKISDGSGFKGIFNRLDRSDVKRLKELLTVKSNRVAFRVDQQVVNFRLAFDQ